MRNVPHHSPYHLKKDWETFVTTPWTMPRTKKDMELIKEHVMKGNNTIVNTSTIPCQAYFNYTGMNSCLKDPFNKNEF